MRSRPPIRQWPLLFLLCLLPLLSACGQKGDLYLPDEPAAQAPATEPEQAEEEKAE